MKGVTVSVHHGKSKKTGKEYDCLKLSIGRYSTLVFPSPFELEYCKDFITKQSHSSFKGNDELSDSLPDFGDDDDNEE